MNEKTTKPDADLNAQKEEFLDRYIIEKGLLPAENPPPMPPVKPAKAEADAANDLSARKAEFLKKLTDFAKQAGKRLIEKFPDKNFNTYKDFFEHGMRIRLYKKGKFVSLDWLKGYSGRGVKFDMYSLSGITVYYDDYPNILEKFVDVPFEEFTNVFEKLFAELLKEKQKDN